MARQRVIIASLFLTGCMLAPTSTGRGALILKPQVTSGTYQTHTVVPPYTQASIHHLDLKLFTVDGTEHDLGISKTLYNADLGNTVTFSNLRAGLTYRIKATAYSSSSVLISSEDQDSYTDIHLDTDDHPAFSPLKVRLINQPFNGQATSSGIVVTPGGYSTGTESFSAQAYVSVFASGLSQPRGIAADASGNIYVADTGTHCLRKITPQGVVSVLAGTPGVAGTLDGMGTSAQFNGLRGVIADATGTVYVSDTNSHTIRKVTPSGQVTTLAGRVGVYTYADGTGTQACFYEPLALALDASGNLYIAENAGHRIRRMAPNGVVTTLAGNGTAAYVDGPALSASFARPGGLAVNAQGVVYVADMDTNSIRRIEAGVVSTLAGGTEGVDDGLGTLAKFGEPYGLTIDPSGNLYVADQGLHRIRKVTPEGMVSTIAGSVAGNANGLPLEAKFNWPRSVALDQYGNLYISDSVNNCIRRLD